MYASLQGLLLDYLSRALPWTMLLFFPRDHAFKSKELCCPEGEATISFPCHFREETEQAACY